MSNHDRTPNPAADGKPAGDDGGADFPYGENAPPTAPGDAPPDPFDPASLRLTGDMTAALGVKKVLWLNHGIVGDDTHGHIDDLARFVNPTTVVTVVEPTACGVTCSPSGPSSRGPRTSSAPSPPGGR